MSRRSIRPESDHPTWGRGWYPDPDDSSRRRYWNGKGWSERTRATPTSPPPDIEGLPRLVHVRCRRPCLVWASDGTPVHDRFILLDQRAYRGSSGMAVGLVELGAPRWFVIVRACACFRTPGTQAVLAGWKAVGDARTGTCGRRGLRLGVSCLRRGGLRSLSEGTVLSCIAKPEETRQPT